MIIAFGTAIILCISFYFLIKIYPWAILATSAVYAMFTTIISVVYVELVPSYLAETSVYSLPIGATWRVLIYTTLIIFFMIMGGVLTQRYFRILPRQPEKVDSYMFFSFVAISLLLLQLVNVVGSGLAFSGDRHNLWLNVPFSSLRAVLGVLMIFVPFYAGVLVARGQILNVSLIRNCGFILFICYFFYIWASSQSFHGFLVAGIMFAAPVYLIFSKSKTPFKMPFFFLATIFVFLSLLYGMQGIGSRGIGQFFAGDHLQTALYRILVLQGAVHYTADMFIAAGMENVSSDLIFGDRDILVQTFLGPEQAWAYTQRGVNLAGSLSGSAILVFGFVGAIPILALYGLILGITCVFVMYVIEDGYGPTIFSAAYILLWTTSVFTTGTFSSLLDPKYLSFVMFTLIVMRVRRLKKE